jgi:uncharacterized protein involved in exopolysaccharide biosynthesis
MDLARLLVTHAESSSLRDILVVPFKHWRSIALIFVVGTLSGLAASVLMTPQYTATSRLLVQVGREKTASLAVERRQEANVSLIERPQDINDEVEILRDPMLMTKLLPAIRERLQKLPAAAPERRIGVARQWVSSKVAELSQQTHEMLEAVGWASPPLSEDEALRMKLLAALDIEFPKDTDVIDVNFTAPDRAFAAYVVNEVVRVFQEEHIRVHGTENTTSFYTDQLDQARTQLAEVEQSLADFLKSGQISNIDAEKTLALNGLAETDKELNQTRIALDDVTQKLAATERSYQRPGDWLETLDPDDAQAAIKALDESFVTLSTERTRLLGHFAPTYPAVVSIEAQLRQLREAKYSALKARYTARRGEILDRIASLQAKIQSKKDELARLGDRTLEYDRLTRRRDQLQAETAEYRQKVEDLRIREDLDAHVFSSIKVISEAVPPPLPSAPRKTLIVAASAVASLLFALAFAIIAEFFNHTFRHERDVRRILDIPLLATVPHVTR